jgi:predicted DCC family thiol-disulfide oxidoreductase YuxK
MGSQTAGLAGPVILFDGVCNLCNWWVSFVMARDHHRRFRFATLQGRTGTALMRATYGNAAAPDSIVLVNEKRVSTRSSAALRILRLLGFPWSLATVFLLVPPPIRDAVYDLIARNRYRWFGQPSTCRLPTPEERGFFLD